jgi:phosphomevalonate kinase
MAVLDKDNVLRLLDEVDNMIMILDQVVERNMKIDPAEARNRFHTIRQKLARITDRVSGS